MLKYLFLLCLIPAITYGEEIKLMTWNTYMLPKPIKSSHQKLRTHAIADYFSHADYDVIFLQEAFSPYFRRTLKASLKNKYPYYKRLEKKFGLFSFMGPGLVALSKYPMKAIDHVYFKKCATSDCFATKGAHLVEVTLPSGKKLQVANTHMQAGKKYADIRKLQLDQIRELLKRNKRASIPQLLVGDLNVDSADLDEFNGTLSLLQMNPVKHELFIQSPPSESPERTPVVERIRDFFSAGFAVTCLKEGNESNPKLLDHVLYLDLDQQIKFKDDQIIFPEFNLKGKSCPLSDHRPRVVKLEI